jgi:Cu(I)/Ag(I) efflux system membrane fusion protein
MACVMGGCSRRIDAASALTVQHTISPDPPRVGPTTVVLRVRDRDSKPLSGVRIELEADMSHAGMAPVLEETKEITPGEYQAEVNFGMAGDWIILLHMRLPSGQTLERQFNVSGVRPN